ncbi:hypothetical protein BGY98DRAFT_64404 [Russula aff. rugulosa BPL654]|nr:hypothetical protein BGY98DRAFT_64404 [Russula aff. rugulosa BPL654]
MFVAPARPRRRHSLDSRRTVARGKSLPCQRYPNPEASHLWIVLDFRTKMVLVSSADPSSQPDQLPLVTRPITQMNMDAREKTVLSKAVAVHTVAHITQIWGDRLRLISLCASFFTTVDSLLFKLASGKNDGSLTANWSSRHWPVL